MKNFYKACLIPGLFSVLLSCDVYAMNDNNLKRKEHPDSDEDERKPFSTAAFKKRKLLAANNEYLKTVKFPVVFDKYSGIPWAPLDKHYVMQTEKYEAIVRLSEKEKKRLLEQNIDLPYNDYDQDYESKRFIVGCLLLSGIGINRIDDATYKILSHASYNCDYWLVSLALRCGLNPNVRCFFYTYRSPLGFAKTVEMADLLMQCGATFNTFLPDVSLYPLVQKGNWLLLEFFLKRNIPWNYPYTIPWNVLVYAVLDAGKLEQSYLRTLKIMFSEGYWPDAKTLDLVKNTIKLAPSEKAIFMQALKDRTFPLHAYLYRLKHDGMYEDQSKALEILKTQELTDITIKCSN